MRFGYYGVTKIRFPTRQFARELSMELDYAQWRNFSKVIDTTHAHCVRGLSGGVYFS